ncbi:hypothetical protein ANCCAN_10018 [Ancylostoma caninum]|uniref:DUF1308 domain-containing protein n=1 Tax=Ancylostoma caninum TaxID=29170 RepID=A0A368GHY3_ANCCA|nr:hypothetical protein ANCCAN_10018 [Ancylostoma caninum]
MFITEFMLTRTPTRPTPLLSQVPRNSSLVSEVAFSGRCLLVSVNPMTSYLIFLVCIIKSSMEASDASIIFGSGDHYRAVTATANKHFVSSAYHQGVSFDVILHESRALSEQKELPLTNMD